MTRTARSQWPKAVLKDRHDNRSGLDTSLRKGGAGGHNWGNALQDERDIAINALEDEALEAEELSTRQDVVADQAIRSASSTSSTAKPVLSRADSQEEDLEEAIKARKNMMNKKNIDLSAIARTSVAASTSPPRADGLFKGPGRDGRQLPVSSTVGM